MNAKECQLMPRDTKERGNVKEYQEKLRNAKESRGRLQDKECRRMLKNVKKKNKEYQELSRPWD